MQAFWQFQLELSGSEWSGPEPCCLSMTLLHTHNRHLIGVCAQVTCNAGPDICFGVAFYLNIELMASSDACVGRSCCCKGCRCKCKM